MRSLRLLGPACLLIVATGFWAALPVSAAPAVEQSFNIGFSSLSADGCEQTLINRVAGGTGKEGAFMDIDNLSVTNICTGEMLIDVYGSTSDFSLWIHPRGFSGSLSAVVPVAYCNGSACPLAADTLVVELTFTGTGAGPSPDGWYEVIATGMVTDGVTNFTPLPSTEGLARRTHGAS